MNQELFKYCKTKINELLKKGLIRPNKSHQLFIAFYIQNQAEIERGASKLVINYKHLNKSFNGLYIQYPIPNKRDLITRFYNSLIFSIFDIKLGF